MVSARTFSHALFSSANGLALMDCVYLDTCIYRKKASQKAFDKSLHALRIAEYKSHSKQHVENRENQWEEKKLGGKRLTLFRNACVVCCLVFLLWVTNHTSSENKTTFSWFQRLSKHTCLRKYAHAGMQNYVHWNQALCCFCRQTQHKPAIQFATKLVH